MSENSIKDDFDLFQSFKEGNEEAFDMLFRKYYPILCAYSHRFVNLEESEDIVQDAMLWLWQNKEKIVIQSSVSSYLFTIIYHRAMNCITQKDIRNRIDTYLTEEMQSMIQDTDYYQVAELTKLIENAISALPDTYREAFVMHRFKEVSYKEIAEILQISPKTVDYRISKALSQLRQDLKDYLPLLLGLLS